MLLVTFVLTAGLTAAYAASGAGDTALEETKTNEQTTSAPVPEAVKKADGKLACEGVLYRITVKATASAAGEVSAAEYEGKTLKSLVIPEKLSYKGKEYKVTGIDDFAFYNRSTVELILPASVKRLGIGAFAGSDKLTTVKFADKGAELTIDDYAFFECDLLENVNFAADNGIVKIGKAAFAYTPIKSAVLADGCKSIGEMAFYNCSKLKKVSMGANIKKLGTEAFAGCSSKLTLTLRDKLKYISYSDGCFYADNGKTLINGDFAKGTVTIASGIKKIPAYCFEGNKLITKVVVPEGVKLIDDCAFKECTALKSVKLPASVKTIGNYAFYGCSHLTGITIPAGVETIMGNPFMYCPRLATIKVSSDNKCFKAKSNMLFDYDMETLWSAPGVKDSVKLPSTTKFMMPFAFCGNTLMKKFTFNKGFEMPGLGAFYDCKSLAYVYIPNRSIDFSIEAWVVDEDSSEFCGIFHNCAKGLEISLPYSDKAGSESTIEHFIMQHCDSSAILTQRD